MNRTAIAAFLGGALLATFETYAQQPQIPTIQTCNGTQAKGKAIVRIESRADATHKGMFEIVIELKCDRGGYPGGLVEFSQLSMTDSVVQGTIVSTTIEQLTSTGRVTPTLYVNGRCKAESAPGCRFWLMVANNRPANTDKGTPDIVSFLVLNGAGQRVAYGTGPVIQGDLDVAATAN